MYIFVEMVKCRKALAEDSSSPNRWLQLSGGGQLLTHTRNLPPFVASTGTYAAWGGRGWGRGWGRGCGRGWGRGWGIPRNHSTAFPPTPSASPRLINKKKVQVKRFSGQLEREDNRTVAHATIG